MAGKDRRREILAEIEALGPVLPGSIFERTTRCQRSGCHCHSDPPTLHGPYPTWVRQEGRRQVTRTLTDEEAKRARPLISADRRLKELVRELEALGVADFERERRRF